ncbi:MAG: hypothetical protein JSW63_05665, partial [Ignavibacterium sp.]
MKGLICVLVLVLNYTSFSQSYPHLFELRGLEDSLGNIHLFYRYGQPAEPSFSNCWYKDIYHFDIHNSIDDIIIEDGAYSDPYEGCHGIYVSDYEFFDNDPSKYIYGGVDIYIDPSALLYGYDGPISLDAFGIVRNIEISNQYEDLLYLVIDQNRLMKSSDGGYNWEI